MAVSGPKIRIFTNGREQHSAMHDALVPEVFHLVDQIRRDSTLLKPVHGSELGVLSASRAFKDGSNVSVFKYGDWFCCYISVPGGEEYFTEVTEYYVNLSVFYDPVICFDTKTGKAVECSEDNLCVGTTADPEKCIAKRIFRELKVYKNDSGAVSVDEVPQTYTNEKGTFYNGYKEADTFAINRLCSATTKTSTHGLGNSIHCYQAWSKTLDHVTAVAILFYCRLTEINHWCVLCDVDGKPYIFELGHIKSDWWPTAWYIDLFQVGGVDTYNTTPGYKGFDLWKEKKDIDGAETKEYHYFLSMAADSYNQVDVWDLTATKPTKKWRAFGISSISKFIEDNNLHFPYVSDGWEGRHIRFVGLKKKTFYWAVLDCHYGRASGQMPIESALGKVFWENDKASGEIDFDTTECGFQFAILDEYAEEIKCVDRISCQKCESSYGDVLFVPNYYAHGFNCYTWDCGEASDCDTIAGNIAGGIGDMCSLYYGGAEYKIQNFTGERYCTTYPKCDWDPEYGVPGAVMVCDGTDPMYGPAWLGSFGNVWNYFEISDQKQHCDQTGLEAGEYESRLGSGQNYSCWQDYLTAIGNPPSSPGEAWRCHCNRACGACGRCSCGISTQYIDGYCFRWQWDNYYVAGPTVNEAAVLPDGIKGSYSGTVLNGELVVCDGDTKVDTRTWTETEGDFPDGNAEDFAQSHWPYYPSYAIAKSTVSCTTPITTEKVKRNSKTGEEVFHEFNKLSGEKLFSKCQLESSGKNWSIVRDNKGLLYDTLGIVKNKYAQFFFIGTTQSLRRYFDYDRDKFQR